MKILVLGSSGMAGHMISRFFLEQGYDVTGFARHGTREWRVIEGDAYDRSIIEKILLQDKYDVVINCIGILNRAVDQNVSQGIYINSYLPHLLSEILDQTGGKLIHLSTDCVFAGNTGPYTEESICDGATLYDRTKALGEVKDGKHLTFRMSIIGPDINVDGIGLFHWFMKQRGTIQGYTKAMWSGVTTLTLAQAIQQAIKEDLCGLYHLVNNTSISKYDLCQLFNHYFRKEEVKIEPYDGVVLDKTLKSTRNDFGFHVPAYETMIAVMRIWVEQHISDYPCYRNQIR